MTHLRNNSTFVLGGSPIRPQTTQTQNYSFSHVNVTRGTQPHAGTETAKFHLEYSSIQAVRSVSLLVHPTDTPEFTTHTPTTHHPT